MYRPRKSHHWPFYTAPIVLVLLLFGVVGVAVASHNASCNRLWRLPSVFDRIICRHAVNAIDNGRQTFRYDTFGDEAFWGDTLGLHETIQGEEFGGIGPGLSPQAALELGLKVDVDAL